MVCHDEGDSFLFPSGGKNYSANAGIHRPEGGKSPPSPPGRLHPAFSAKKLNILCLDTSDHGSWFPFRHNLSVLISLSADTVSLPSVSLHLLLLFIVYMGSFYTYFHRNRLEHLSARFHFPKATRFMPLFDGKVLRFIVTTSVLLILNSFHIFYTRFNGFWLWAVHTIFFSFILKMWQLWHYSLNYTLSNAEAEFLLSSFLAEFLLFMQYTFLHTYLPAFKNILAFNTVFHC